MSRKKLTVSIVNYNTGDYLISCLNSLFKNSDKIDLSVWVIDNASSDNSFQKAKENFPKVNFIQNKENLGFARAHNVVLREIKSEYILLLNPDTEIKKGVISTVFEFMEENSDVGAATCQILLPDGKVDLTAHRGFPTPLASLLYFLGDDSRYHLSTKNLKSIHEVDAISGAFFFTRKSVLQKVGLFDEDYFLYAEDIDLCFRIKQAGFKIMYLPTVNIIHHKGISSGLKKHSQSVSMASFETKQKSLDAFYQTMKLFYKKHLEKGYPFFINWLVYFGIDIKWMLAKRNLTV